MNHRHIEILQAIVKAGGVSRAAEALGISQPAVSRSIGELEQALGFRLFDRVRNRLVITHEGRLFYDQVEASFRGLDHLRATAARIRDHGSGGLRLGCQSVLSSSLVPRALQRFRERHPQSEVTLMVLPSRDIRDGVVSGAFDLGLTSDEIDVSGVKQRLFVRPRLSCIMPAGHPLAGRSVIRPEDLADIPFVNYVREDRARQQLDRVFAETGVAPRIVVSTLYAATVCALVAESLGVGLVSAYAAAGIDATKVVLRPFEPAIHTKSLLVLPMDRPISGMVRDLIDCLMEAR
ncbi:LysR family transcriptional regulator [Bosea sp. WAO]|uniref:LysR substrate-binding domain-containing protein n=1 Tax=Bosea sp. WAO TaxID=406341 RepID=UPI000748353D|nr:LysR substrate-binding domain-containing protein [Bosea sp. WAO]KUL96477.1 LysR family transcriptional regulator [Bosea sp. WAO]